jgi:photosystem II stability/assembly factor-like uncharacterized protein
MKTIAFISLCFVLALGVDSNIINFKPYGVTINRVATIEASGVSWAVGDSGQVFKLNDTGCVVNRFTLNAEYNLTGVSFANSQIGYIVEYKRDSTENGPKWKGGIWKTTDGGTSWDSLRTPYFPIPTPFLDVHAVDENNAWISCGQGYVLITRNSGQTWWQTPQKPGCPNHFGWLWGIDALDANTAWVCSDQSGLIAKTTNSSDS